MRIRDRVGDALEPGASYRLLGANRTDATHYQIRLPDGGGDRWVPVACGRTQAAGGGTDEPGTGREYVLAVSWQPAFCEGHADKPECASQTETRFDASNLTLHGLWPQPRSAVYCGVAAAEQALDRPGHLASAAARSSSTRTPARHSTKRCPARSRRSSGTNGSSTAPATARRRKSTSRNALHLLRQLNDSAVRAVLAGRVGGAITADQLAQAFDASFGTGAGARVTMDCDRDGRRHLVVELRLNLAGEITEGSRLGDLLAAAPDASAELSVWSDRSRRLAMSRARAGRRSARRSELEPVGNQPSR